MSTLPARLTPKARYHHGDLRNVLLATARALIAETGIDGFRMRELAKRAGVSHTAAYNHFADKAALVEALVVEAYGALSAALRAAAAAGGDPVERLMAVGVAYVLFAHEHRTEFRFMFRPEHSSSGAETPSAPALRFASDAAYAVLVDTVRACLQAGVVAGEPETLVLTAWCCVHGLAALLIDGPRCDEKLASEDVATLAGAVVATLAGGFLKR